MKLMFASDIHGSRSACEAMLNAYKAEGAERLILLGDLLYHGPRNNLPDEYDPKGVMAARLSLPTAICSTSITCRRTSRATC